MVNARPRSATASYLTDTLPTALPPIFEQAQHSTATHRKNIVALRKIQETCATITERTPKGIKLVGEKAFNTLFTDMVNRLLPIKKGVTVADRVVKFIASYVAYTTEQDAKEGEEDSTSTRFTAKLLRHLLAGMEAKDKNVRFRVTLILVSLINGLGEIDDDMYVVLRGSLLDRSRDKETAVRVQAALGLAKLQSGEDEEDLDEGEESLSEVLLDMLRYDPAAEVRRAALYNLPLSTATLPHILARTRDTDPILRRTVYHGSLSTSALPDARVLSIAQREQVVRNGLGDREGSVRKAAAGMLGGWVDQAEGDLLQFLSRFDVITSEVAEEALLSVFVSRPEVLDLVELDEAFWADLTPEKAFLARVYGEHLRSANDDTRFEESMPVVTALAFRTQDEYNKLVGAASEEEAGDVDERAFIVGELLKLAVHLDYADETGRRKMFQLTREMISQSNLPEALIALCLDVLTKISDGERDLIRVVVDVITELREGDGDEDPMSSQASVLGTPAPSRRNVSPKKGGDDPEAAMKMALIDLRCLFICISLLERVNSPLQDNSVFHGLLPDLIIPAVRNKDEPALRDQGLVCLGLCCMIDEKMAANSFGLFIQQLTAADDELKVKVVQIVFDLLMVQDITTLVSKTMPVDKVVELVRHTLSQDDSAVQAMACEGTAKLMLAGMISDESVLQSLVLLYFSPETSDNQSLRQCLTYFLPVYCYSSPENQRHMLNIFSETFEMLAQLIDEQEGDVEMPPLAQMGLMMVDWLDPQKVVEREGVNSDMLVHLDLGIEILKTILVESSRDIRKALVSFLSKLNLPESEEVEDWKVKSMALFLTSIRSKCPLADTASKNSLNKFDAAILKRYPAELEGFNEDTWRSEERAEVRDLYGFIDDVEERDADGASEVGSTRRRRGSRQASEAPSEATDIISEDEEDDDETPKKGKKTTGRMQTLEEEDEEEDDDVESLLDE